MTSKSKLTPVELKLATSLLNHGPIVLVSSAHGGKQNVMTAAWAMPLDFVPPKVAVVIGRESFTRELMEASGAFVLSIPAKAIADKVLWAGSHSGREVDKFSESGLVALPASKVSAPLIDGCVACLECKVIAEPHNQQQYDLFFGEVVAAWADPRVFSDGQWQFNDDSLRTIHYTSQGNFFAIGEPFRVDDK